MSEPLIWIVTGSFLMSAVAMVGGVTVFCSPATLERLLLPLVSLAAATLLGGAFFHMLPEGLGRATPLSASLWMVAGFTTFLLLEQLLHWHHSHSTREADAPPVTYLILLGDGIHNFIGGLAIASAFLIDPRAGISAWIAAVAHEIPQELGDFGVLVHGGWSQRRALIWNFLSALTFPLGALIAYGISQSFDVTGLVLFGAGNFIYIAASDLIPEIKQQASLHAVSLHFGFFITGLGLMLILAL
ncbi:ZIP family metal transporter [Microbulbifer thermotolerans]|uniref:ZIP family metal transporter n=1 Tax=Microbulbifer thermotolerans TaxID=252514 RepID=UPI0008F2342A|nr:ZIP family metal transporter [Microbulbifer thermotolerans]MCX2782377.1 ZIP family metal transporter [Microbulbifer thermotolerans]MCX2833634.1 ZIP family metal transporter [Microbulbifer thermotolerans]WKT62202.1 ZIP family metal transporter [Microbulbifer thermotolerans]SFB85051.1 zinc and cadmium transporter [Microbulbifer thermotolerans]